MAPVVEFEKMMADANKEATDEAMEAWNVWMSAHKNSFVDMGAPVGNTMRVTNNIVDKAKNEVGGYSIVQAESHEAAANLMKNSPHFELNGAWIDVMEYVDM